MVPVTTVLLKEINAQLTFPAGKWKQSVYDNKELTIGQNFTYVKESKPGSTAFDLYAKVNITKKRETSSLDDRIFGGIFKETDDKTQNSNPLRNYESMYDVTDLSASPPQIKDFKNAIVFQFMPKKNTQAGGFGQDEYGYYINLTNEKTIISICLTSSYKRFQNSYPM